MALGATRRRSGWLNNLSYYLLYDCGRHRGWRIDGDDRGRRLRSGDGFNHRCRGFRDWSRSFRLFDSNNRDCCNWNRRLIGGLRLRLAMHGWLDDHGDRG
jgi:hypothetical protein